MCSPIPFLRAFVASPLLILGLAIICCGCKGGFGRNINPYAAYGSPRIPPPGTGAIGTNPGSGSAGGSAPVGTGVSSNQPKASLDNPATTTNNATNSNTATPTNTATPPYYSNNASLRDSGNGTTTGSVPATPVSGGDQWRPVDRSNSLPQSRVPNQGTSTQGGSGTTQNYTTQNDNASGASTREGFASQIAPASYNEPAMADNASGSQPTSVNHLLNGMRVNDATRQSPPAQFTPPADARPLSTATGSEPHTQSGWNASGNNALSQQGQPTTNVTSQMTQEEFAAFVQGVPPQITQPNATTQSVAIATTLPNAASFDPNASIQTAAPGTSNNSAGTSSGWRTRDE